jgi:tRNA(Ile)-lysidine synthase
MSFIRLLNKIPNKVCLALSGGLDSMVCLDFLIKGKKDILALHFNHGTENSKIYENFVVNFCKDNNINLRVGYLDEEIPKGRSKEDYWRECRYNFLNKEREGRKVITCHHLDDAVETWIFSSLKGESKIIPYERDYIIRPFLLNKRLTLENWQQKNSIPFVQDYSNYDNCFARNFIRNKMMQDVLFINPGIHKNIKKKIEKRWKA